MGTVSCRLSSQSVSSQKYGLIRDGHSGSNCIHSEGDISMASDDNSGGFLEMGTCQEKQEKHHDK